MNKETIEYRFFLSIIRHFVTWLCGMLVAWGWVDTQTATQFSESAAAKITIAVLGLIATLWYSYKDKVWEFLKTNIARLMPPDSSMQEIAEVASVVADKKSVAKGEAEVDPTKLTAVVKKVTKEEKMK